MTALYLKPQKMLPLKFKGYYFSYFVYIIIAAFLCTKIKITFLR